MRGVFEHPPGRDIHAPSEARNLALGPEWDRAHAELWREPAREPDPPAKPSRLPLIAAIVAILLGAMALIGLRDRIVRIAPLTAAIVPLAKV